MGKHAARGIDALAELRAKLSTPDKWDGLRKAILFLRECHAGRHAAFDTLSTARNAKAMRDYYLGDN